MKRCSLVFELVFEPDDPANGSIGRERDGLHRIFSQGTRENVLPVLHLHMHAAALVRTSTRSVLVIHNDIDVTDPVAEPVKS